MREILDIPRKRLTEILTEELGEKRFRADQVWQWLWQKMARDFSAMTNVSRTTRERLAENFAITWPTIVLVQKSADTTTKFLLELADGTRIETVLIPSTDHAGKVRWTQCLSTQVGCPMACTFCATGQAGFTRNMTMGEMLGQVLVARSYVNDVRPDHPIIRNLVFMGMGEPLLNLDALLPALETLNDPTGLAFSPRRITVSTCGIERGIEKLGASGLAFLAISLHAPNQALREKIMPRAASLPLPALLKAIKAYPVKNRERITFEYLLLRNVNDELDHARELARIVASVNGKLNLIPYNPTPGSPYKAPDPDRILAFEQELWKHNITAIVRQSRGQDIDAACGQLRAASENIP